VTEPAPATARAVEPFDLVGAGVVVTGAASGIGAELARRLAAAGARVVVNDLDGVAAQRVARAVGGVAVGCDAASVEGVRTLVDTARDALGAIYLFCANAGVAPAGGVEGPGAASESDWAQAWDVNVLAHVRAAQVLLPDWLERGRGRLLVTASAAGLLTMLGSAPYAVSKHAAVAFAEWLRATYAHRGVVVQALCPQGVRTPMLASSGDVGRALLEPDAVDVSVVGGAVLDALRDGRFLVLPHPEVSGYVQAKAADPDAWLAAMNRIQQRL
jgi:NAD(P)-dependent dehydrogenase (short-subunit alcohol dehydrogenase family)